MDPETVASANPFLDPQVLSAVVIGLFSVLTGALGWLANRSRQAERKRLQQDQLSKFYEPMDYLLSFKPSAAPEEVVADIARLMAEQYRYVTPSIQSEIRKLLSKESLSPEDLSLLRVMVSSVYNWLRRSLGYPYDKKAINYIYLPLSVRTLYSLFDFISWVACFLSVILAFAAVGFVFSLIPVTVIESLTGLLLILVLGFGLYIFGWMALHLPKSPKTSGKANNK